MPLSKNYRFAAVLLAGTAAVALSAPAFAQEQTEPVPMSELVVTGDIAFRNRTDDVNPVLEYDLEYFQRFEPISVGEMLKRVPGVTFTSDVLEFDGVSMRGLPPGYTKILINGRRAPGGENDGSFFVDRIPAELVERVELIRSPRADEPSDGVAGTLNIILKEGATLRGGLAKAGTLINEDGEVRGSGAIAYAGGTDRTSWWAGLNYQGRRNPKKKQTLFYDGDFGASDGIELQDDTRDGVDVSANGEFTHEFETGRIRFSGLIIDTDRDEDELSLTYDNVNLTGFDGAEVQQERIKQKTSAFTFDGKFEAFGGIVDTDLGWNSFRDNTTETVFEGDEEDLSDLALDDTEKASIDDSEFDAGLAYTSLGQGWRLKFGVDYLDKSREVDDGDYLIDEQRLDPYIRLSWEPTAAFKLDAGGRFETTSRRVDAEGDVVSFDNESFNPSLHATYQFNDNLQLRGSVARTVRRPDFDLLTPKTSLEEPTDDDAFRGNPKLLNEKSLGFDLGVEYRLGAKGVFGVNLFYRDIEDLIEVVNTGIDVDEDPLDDEKVVQVPAGTGFSLYEPRNVGDGETWGIEFDVSTPLDFIGLPNTGVFFNYTITDSKVLDPFTGVERTFTNQPDRIYNVGFVHTVEKVDMSFGASLYGRSEGREMSLDEDVVVDYDDDLEAFIEKRFADRYVVRLSAMNLLDKEKREAISAYDGDSIDEIIANRRAGDVDSSERESERSGVLYQVTVRATF